MAFRDLNEILEPLELSINGHVYTIPFLGSQDAERLDAHLDGSQPLVEADLRALLLGTAYAEMRAANVPPRAVHLSASTALADYQQGRFVAQVFWESAGDPTAVAGVTERLIGPPAPAKKTKKKAK